MSVVEKEVRAGLKTLKGAQAAAKRMKAEEGIDKVRYVARPCSLSPSRFVVVRIDAEAMREGASLTRPDYVREFRGQRDFAALSGKKSRGSERDSFNRRVFT